MIKKIRFNTKTRFLLYFINIKVIIRDKINYMWNKQPINCISLNIRKTETKVCEFKVDFKITVGFLFKNIQFLYKREKKHVQDSIQNL